MDQHLAALAEQTELAYFLKSAASFDAIIASLKHESYIGRKKVINTYQFEGPSQATWNLCSDLKT